MVTPSSQGFPGGRRNTPSFPQPHQKRVVSIGVENLQTLRVFVGFPHISREVQDLWDSPSLS